MTLHIYAQRGEHQPAYIVGDWLALSDLRDFLTVVLYADATEPVGFNAADGEGYALTVRLAKDADEYVLPYADHWELEWLEQTIRALPAVWPCQFCGQAEEHLYTCVKGRIDAAAERDWAPGKRPWETDHARE